MQGRETSSLIILTAAKQLFALSYDQATDSVVTDSTVSIAERAARPSDFIQTIVIDPAGSFIGVHAYNGLFRVIPLGSPISKKRRGSRKSATTAEEEPPVPLDLDRGYNIR